MSQNASETGQVRWTVADMRAHTVDVVTAIASPEGVTVSFGAKHTSSGGTGVEMRGGVRLSPLSARNLHEVVSRLLEDIAAAANRPR